MTKDDLIDAVWATPYMSEAALTTCIYELRQALGERAQTPRFIETVRGRGYRFIAAVAAMDTPIMAEPEAPPPASLCVGRESELRQLHQWWAAAQQGTRQIVFIAGEVGIGKTTLADAFVSQAAAEAAWIGRGQCIEQYGAGEPYLPLLDAFGQLGRSAGGERLVETLRQYAPSWLLHLPALVSDAQLDALQQRTGSATQARMLRELAEAVEALTAQHPLLLLLEDLHWSDGATLDWLAYMARRRAPSRLLILGTYRPADAMTSDHPIRHVAQDLRSRQQSVDLNLDYLTEAGVAAYLTQRFGPGDLVETLTPALHQRTHGRPLFLVNAVEAMAQQDILRTTPTGWALAGDVDAWMRDVPASLQQLIGQQFERLSSAEQRLLEAASVAGVEFAAAAVEAGLASPIADIEAACDAFSRRGQFLQALEPIMWPDGAVSGQYAFRHALYQEVIYARLTPAQRVRLHRQIGERMELAYGERAEDIAAELSAHFVQGRDLERAVRYLRVAGNNARRRSACREAVANFEQALEGLQQLPASRERDEQAIDLRFDLRLALVTLGDFERILTLLQEAESLAIGLDDAHRLGWLSACMAQYYLYRCQHEQAIMLGQRALDFADISGDMRTQVVSRTYVGSSYYFLGKHRLAVDGLKLNVARLADDLQSAALDIRDAAHSRITAQSFAAWFVSELGDFENAMAWSEAGVRNAEALTAPFSIGIALAAAGVVHLGQGQLPASIAILERGLSICREADLPVLFPRLASHLGAAYALAGRLAEGLPLLEQARGAIQRHADFAFSRPMAHPFERRIPLGRAQRRSRAARLTGSRSGPQAPRNRAYEARALLLLGDIAAHSDLPDVEHAASFYHQALDLASALDMRPLQAHCHRSLGALYQAAGQAEACRTALTRAIRHVRRYGDGVLVAPGASAASGDAAVAPAIRPHPVTPPAWHPSAASRAG